MNLIGVKKMNIKRLQTLANFLKIVTANQFDLSTWYDDDNTCGTTACAIGWATVIPEFSALGFKLVEPRYSDQYLPYFNGYTSWDAVEEFFDLTTKQALFLFTSYYYPNSQNPKHVVDRLEHVITNGFPIKAWNYLYDEYTRL